MRKIIIVLLFFPIFNTLQSQPQLSIELNRPTGTDIYLNDFNITIINNENESVTCYIYGFINKGNEGQIGEGKSSMVEIAPGATRFNSTKINVLEPADLEFTNNDIRDYIIRTSKFPPGDYRFCVQLYLAEEEVLLDESCFEKSVQQFLPPSLIEPENQSRVIKSNPFFSWSPVPNSGESNINYTLKIVEMLGNQSPVGAFESNPLWFSNEDIVSPIFQYPISAREFREEKRYAWKVVAFVQNRKIAESEVWTFFYKKDSVSKDKAKEETPGDELFSKTYVPLGDRQQKGYILIEGFKLHVSFDNQYAPQKLSCKIVSPEGDTVGRDVMDKSQNNGINLNSINVTDYVEPDKVYSFRCTNSLDRIFSFQFMVSEQEKEEVMEEINLEEYEMDQNIHNIQNIEMP